MKLLKSAGFTIIETMLFLAISGFLFVAILAGTGNAVNVQRYHDSVYSLQSFLQGQYSAIVNVDNDALKSDCGSSSNVSRGQSDCVILGRYITSSNDGKTLISYRVIGSDYSTDSDNVSDIELFKQYDISLVQDSDNAVYSETYDLEWGADLTSDKKGGNNISSFSILALRSPNSGIVRTFIDSSNENKSTEDIKAMLSGSFSGQSLKVCVDSNGLLSRPESAVLVHANAAVQSDIEVLGDSDSGC